MRSAIIFLVLSFAGVSSFATDSGLNKLSAAFESARVLAGQKSYSGDGAHGESKVSSLSLSEIKRKADQGFSELLKETEGGKKNEAEFVRGNQLYEFLTPLFEIKIDSKSKKLDMKSCLEAKALAETVDKTLAEETKEFSAVGKRSIDLVDKICK